MWITRCVPVCRAAVASHPLAVGVPAAITTIGAGAALALLFAKPVPKPQLPCGCHQVWIAPTVPMTPKTYAQVMKIAADAALASIPLDNADATPLYAASPDLASTSIVPDLSPDRPVRLLVRLAPPRRAVAVPEPSSLSLLAGALAALIATALWVRRH